LFCDRCGSEIRENDSFCPKCGNPIGEGRVSPAGSRLSRHLRLLGILWLALSAFRLVPGFVLLSSFGQFMIAADPDVPIFVHGMLRAIGAVFVLTGLLGIAAGWGLLTRQPWARMLAIVFGCISLIDIPFGTALGIYTLWVLVPGESEQEYRRLAHAT
jgi:zinc-ribbon domain